LASKDPDFVSDSSQFDHPNSFQASRFIRFQDTGYPFIIVLYLRLSPADPAYKGGAAISIVKNQLLPLVRDMGAHGCEPLGRVKGLLILTILRTIEDLGLFRDIIHSFLAE
jgi:hypothetical protein